MQKALNLPMQADSFWRVPKLSSFAAKSTRKKPAEIRERFCEQCVTSP
jgi:hypothetical protein